MSTYVDKIALPFKMIEGEGMNTKEKLLRQGRRMMWRHGYSNVSLRQIAAAAGADVAMVSRHFGGKQGLFEATLADAFDAGKMDFSSPSELIEGLVHLYETAPRDADDPSIIQMLLMNSGDADVGHLVREFQQENFQKKLESIIGDKSSAALFIAALMGFSVAEKTLKLDGIAKVGTPAYAAQLRHMLSAALGYWD